MSRLKIEKMVRRHATGLLKEKGYISTVELLIRMDRLTPKQVENWRFKRIPYLERVTVGGLGKMNYILKTLKKFAGEQGLYPSKTVYKSWGKGPKKHLRFTKTGNPYVEEMYATHYVAKRVRKK